MTEDKPLQGTNESPAARKRAAGRRMMPSLRIPEQSELERVFSDLAERWRRDTAIFSSVMQKTRHPAYQRIIGMGPAAVPLILRELERRPEHWFWALTAITGVDPVSPEDAGDIRKMTDAWLALGREQGYV